MTPVTVLLFIAGDPYSYDPGHTSAGPDPCRADNDPRRIDEKVRAAEHRDALRLAPWLAARHDLLQALGQLRPQAVHCGGHGTADGLVLVGADGAHPVDAAALVRLFRAAGCGTRLVVLGARDSAPLAEALAAVAGCARGIERSLPDGSALAFNASFYRALAFARAFEQATAAVELEDLEGAERPRLLGGAGVGPAGGVLATERGPRRGPRQVVNVTGDGNRVYVAGGNLHAPGHDRPPADGDGVCRFTNVWYLPRRLRFYEPVNADVGTLIVQGGHVEYRGEKSSLSIGDIHDVAHTRHGGEISNSWVRVAYGDPSAPSEAYFSHRTGLGLDGLLGGSDDLFAVLHQRLRPAPPG